jgi:hypothetical protein
MHLRGKVDAVGAGDVAGAAWAESVAGIEDGVKDLLVVLWELGHKVVVDVMSERHDR